MGLLEKARDRHKGEEIFIVGSGPSIDDLPDGFFDDKISLAMGWVFTAFPNCTYYFSVDRDFPKWVVENRPKDSHKLICACEPVGITDFRNHMDEYGEKPMYAPWGVTGFNGFVESVSNIMRGKACRLADMATCVQPAIQVAAILGARKITLAGCEARSAKYRNNARKRGLDKFYTEKKQKGREYSEAAQRGDTDFFRRARIGVKWLADLFGPYGVEVKRFYYGKGYEDI